MTVERGDEVWLVTIGEDPVELYANVVDAYDAAMHALDEFIEVTHPEGFVDPGVDAPDERLRVWEASVELFDDPVPWRVSVEARLLG